MRTGMSRAGPVAGTVVSRLSASSRLGTGCSREATIARTSAAGSVSTRGNAVFNNSSMAAVSSSSGAVSVAGDVWLVVMIALALPVANMPIRTIEGAERNQHGRDRRPDPMFRYSLTTKRLLGRCGLARHGRRNTRKGCDACDSVCSPRW